MTELAPLLPLAREIVERCTARRLKIATAESCTSGLIAATLTEISGSSAVVDRGFVTYSDEAKSEMLGVPVDLVATRGAVSEEVAMAMVQGAIHHSRADLAVAVTGVAGPTGGTAEKPVGLVHFAALRRGNHPWHVVEIFENLDRSGVRLASVDRALRMLRDLIAG